MLQALSAGGPPPRPPSQHSAWGRASFRNPPPRRPPGVSSLPGRPLLVPSCLPGSATRAGCPWGSAFPRCQKVPGSLFEPHSSSILPDRGGAVLGVPQKPCSRFPRSHGAMDPAVLLGVLAWPPGSTPSPPLQLPQHSFPDTTQRRQASSCLPGSGSALWGGTRPTSLHTPPRAVPSPQGSPLGRDVLFSPLPGAWRMGWGPQGPPLLPVYLYK